MSETCRACYEAHELNKRIVDGIETTDCPNIAIPHSFGIGGSHALMGIEVERSEYMVLPAPHPQGGEG